MGISNSKSKKGPLVSSKDKAILELKVQRDKLKQYEKKIRVVVDREMEIARKQVELGNHGAARIALLKKKYQLSLLEKTANHLMNIEQLTGTIEYALVEQQILEKLQIGSTVLSQIHKEMDLDKVERIMDDTADGIAYQKEIEETMARDLTPQDEEDIMKELDLLAQQEELDLQAKREGDDQNLVFPSVPQHQQTEVSDIEFPAVPSSNPREKVTNPKKQKPQQVTLSHS